MNSMRLSLQHELRTAAQPDDAQRRLCSIPIMSCWPPAARAATWRPDARISLLFRPHCGGRRRHPTFCGRTGRRWCRRLAGNRGSRLLAALTSMHRLLLLHRRRRRRWRRGLLRLCSSPILCRRGRALCCIIESPASMRMLLDAGMASRPQQQGCTQTNAQCRSCHKLSTACVQTATGTRSSHNAFLNNGMLLTCCVPSAGSSAAAGAPSQMVHETSANWSTSPEETPWRSPGRRRLSMPLPLTHVCMADMLHFCHCFSMPLYVPLNVHAAQQPNVCQRACKSRRCYPVP